MLTLVQFVAVGAILAVHAWTVRRRETALRLVDPARTARRPRGPGQRALLGGVLLSVALLILLPLGVLVERSFDAPGGYGLAFYRALGSDDDGGTFLVAADGGDRELAAVRRSPPPPSRWSSAGSRPRR